MATSRCFVMEKCRSAYFEDTYRFKDCAVIESVNRDEKGYFLVLDKTIFYPQGGGQPSDEGMLKAHDLEILVTSVKTINGEIRHYTAQPNEYLIGQTVVCSINPEKRILHAKLHTAGHLISNVIEKHFANYKAVKGHHFPGECYVEFNSKASEMQIDSNKINQILVEEIRKNAKIEVMQVSKQQLAEICPDLPYAIPDNQMIRIVRIGEFPFQPCGGTHLKSTAELGNLVITRLRVKNNTLKIYYAI